VLLVEDDPMVRKFSRKTLEMHGYNVLVAEDGEEALEKSSKGAGTINLLITDVLMPGLDCRELARRFQAIRPNTPVVFMSGYTDESIVELGLVDEGALFIQKPFTPVTLIETVRKALDGVPSPVAG